jgi:hypothetical protein
MKCCRHVSVDAVAVCRSCGRALCPECAGGEEKRPVTCGPECSRRAERDELVQELFGQHYAAYALTYRSLTIMFAALGAIVTVSGAGFLFFLPRWFNEETWPLLLAWAALGLVCVAGAVLLRRIWKKYAAILRRLAELGAQ